MLAYMLLVGVPVLGLFGILEAGRGLAAPLAIGGEWTVLFDPTSSCASLTRLRQPALSISQSGAGALITLNDGRGLTLEASVNGSTLAAKSLQATIAGKSGRRALEGTMDFEGCVAVPFRAVRQAPSKKGE